MDVLVTGLALAGILVGVAVGVVTLQKSDDRERCESISRATGADVRFIEPHWGDWGCFAPQDEDWVDVETGRVIP